MLLPLATKLRLNPLQRLQKCPRGKLRSGNQTAIPVVRVAGGLRGSCDTTASRLRHESPAFGQALGRLSAVAAMAHQGCFRGRSPRGGGQTGIYLSQCILPLCLCRVPATPPVIPALFTYCRNRCGSPDSLSHCNPRHWCCPPPSLTHLCPLGGA